MPAARKLLIVNADDLGRTPGINAGVFAAHDNGIVTSATLMVAHPAAEEAAAELPRHPGLGVGLHVSLTGGTPVLPPERVPSLVDSEGRLPRRPDALAAAAPAEIAAEVEAQLDRFRRLTGCLPTHLDSHHHAHRLPAVCDALAAVARREDLPVRNASPETAERLRRAGLRTPDAFVDGFYGAGATLDSLLAILAALGPVITELMCHPGTADDQALRRDSTYADDRERELAVLTDPAARRALAAHGVALTHFGSAWPSGPSAR